MCSSHCLPLCFSGRTSPFECLPERVSLSQPASAPHPRLVGGDRGGGRSGAVRLRSQIRPAGRLDGGAGVERSRHGPHCHLSPLSPLPANSHVRSGQQIDKTKLTLVCGLEPLGNLEKVFTQNSFLFVTLDEIFIISSHYNYSEVLSSFVSNLITSWSSGPDRSLIIHFLPWLCFNYSPPSCGCERT